MEETGTRGQNERVMVDLETANQRARELEAELTRTDRERQKEENKMLQRLKDRDQEIFTLKIKLEDEKRFEANQQCSNIKEMEDRLRRETATEIARILDEEEERMIGVMEEAQKEREQEECKLLQRLRYKNKEIFDLKAQIEAETEFKAKQQYANIKKMVEDRMRKEKETEIAQILAAEEVRRNQENERMMTKLEEMEAEFVRIKEAMEAEHDEIERKWKQKTQDLEAKLLRMGSMGTRREEQLQMTPETEPMSRRMTRD